MFKEVPDEIGDDDDPVSLTLAEMDRFGVERGLVTVEGDDGQRALKEHPHRFIPSVGVDPNQGMDAHGCEPWADLAVKLMLKWPNLYYSTSAFAPKYYPKAIVDYANTRGAHEVIYAGYSPMGLSLERIMDDMPSVPFHDDVWPKFLRENALRVLGVDGADA